MVDLTASHQQLYWSLQGVKVDLEAVVVTANGSASSVPS